jgi:hypothetical protein
MLHWQSLQYACTQHIWHCSIVLYMFCPLDLACRLMRDVPPAEVNGLIQKAWGALEQAEKQAYITKVCCAAVQLHCQHGSSICPLIVASTPCACKHPGKASVCMHHACQAHA